MKIFAITLLALAAGTGFGSGLVADPVHHAAGPAPHGLLECIHLHVARLLHGDRNASEDMLGAHLDALCERAQLSPQQRSALAERFEDAELAPRVGRVVRAHRAQVQAMFAHPVGAKAIEAASTELAAAIEAATMSIAQVLHETHANLSPDQLERVHGSGAHAAPWIHGQLAALQPSLERWIELSR